MKPRKKPKMPKIPLPVKRHVSGAPGVEPADLPLSSPDLPAAMQITCIDYSPQQILVQEVKNVESFLAEHRPSWSAVRWIHMEGLGRLDVVRALAEKYQLHPLAIEDVLHADQRPKAEDYPGHADNPGRLLVLARGIHYDQDRLTTEQLSIFLGRKTLLTFSELGCSCDEPIRQRLQKQTSRLRENDASFLLHALLDAMVDQSFPVLEKLSTRIEEIEEAVMLQPNPHTLQQVYEIKRELLLLRRTAWPMRDLINQLLREKHECLSETTRTYFRDVHDHCVQVMDFIETYREITGDLTETYMSNMSNRLNETMKVLTVIGTIFIPLTFLAGVYGMNMPIPENDWPGIKEYSYPVFWAFCLTTAACMLFYFKKRQWI